LTTVIPFVPGFRWSIGGLPSVFQDQAIAARMALTMEAGTLDRLFAGV
jgi:hypothetical protein